MYRRARQHRGCSAWFALPLLLTGCASEGPLRPPSLHLPGPVRGLRAERTGDAVGLTWTNPVRTSDGVSLTGKHGPVPVTVVICRKAAPADACQTAGSLQVSGGTGTWQETLPPALAAGPARALTYHVQTLNRMGKGVPLVPVEALAGAAPHPVLALSAVPVSQGVALHWQPDREPGADHVLLQVTRGAALPGAVQAAGERQRPARLSVELRGADAGGALDTGARLGVAQAYTVQRTRTVHLSTGADLLMSSAPASVAEQANARPHPLPPPAGLEALVNTLAQPEVALVWDPVEGAAGYLLFRAVGQEEAVPLNTVAIMGFAYTDAAVSLGQQLRYSIATVDSSGQVGPHSVPVVVDMPAR